MKDWTPAAREELERGLAEHHARLLGIGVDADEVIDDLRRHVQTELGGKAPPSAEVVRATLRGLLADADVPGVGAAGGPGAPPVAAEREAPRLRRAVLHWAFLVVLPLITLGFELSTGLCATELFDPLANWIQLLAVAAVPVVFGAVLLLPAWLRSPERIHHLRVGAALATGVCVFYALQFAVLTPFAFVAIIFFGMGLLPLAPLFAFAVGIDLMGQLRRMARQGGGVPIRKVWPFLFVAPMALLLSDLSPLCASLGMRWYASDDPVEQARGLALLRSRLVDPADIDHPWRASGVGSGIHMLLGLVTGNDGRLWGADFDRAKFAATGASRDLADPDLWRRSRGRGRAGEGRWSVLGDLALDGSRLDGSIDPDLLYGYVEWTMTLRNSEAWPLEGRATLQLPPGGVVSRVTLWINGEEREAAFAGRAAATKAYESVAIVQRRDPILVTTAGPDRVRLRCFPVPGQGEMKFRLGMTFPLRPTPDGAAADLVLPSIVEANFAIPSSLEHHLWIGRANGDLIRVEDADTKALRAPVAREALGGMTVRVRRDPTRTSVLARGIDETSLIRQELHTVEEGRRRVFLVIDGNPRVLCGRTAELLEALALERAVGVDLWIALERPVHRAFASPGEARDFLAAVVDAGEVSDAQGQAAAIPRRGGFDNGPALVAALTEAAAGEGGGGVLWLCGPQVASAGSGDAIRQILERAGGRSRLRVMPVVPGRNDLLDALDGRPEVRGVGRFSAGALRAELDRAAGAPMIEAVRSNVPLGSGTLGAEIAATRHLARLWAASEVARLAAAGPAHQAEAVALAVKHQLVSTVSGAVVLETQAQYEAHGLRPVDPATVPTVPETGSLAVVLIAAAALTGAAWVRRRRASVPRC
jgi:hypothetical protein